MKRMVSYIVCGCFLFGVGAAHVYAQPPLFMPSWTSDNSVPVNYEGKKFPITGSTVYVAFELIGQNKDNFGKILDLSNREVRWYINEKFVTNKKGSNVLIVNNEGLPGSTIQVRASVENFDTETQNGNFINYTFSIPIVSPQVVMHRPIFSSQNIPATETSFYATPYFFKKAAERLSVSWTANGADMKGVNSFLFKADPKPFSGKSMRLEVRAYDPTDIFSSAKDSLTIRVQ